MVTMVAAAVDGDNDVGGSAGEGEGGGVVVTMVVAAAVDGDNNVGDSDSEGEGGGVGGGSLP